MFIKSVWVLFSVFMGALRLNGHKSQTFQAIAHLVVGGFFAIWLVDHSQTFYLTLGVSLSILEVSAFLMFKKNKEKKINDLD